MWVCIFSEGLGVNDRRSQVPSFTGRLYVPAGNELPQTAY